MNVVFMKTEDMIQWNRYANTSNATVWHDSRWKKVLEETYPHEAHYLMAKHGPMITGILPLFHFKGLLFGDSLVSMPFLDGGGIVADSAQAAKALLLEALSIADRMKIPSIELRHLTDPEWLGDIEKLTTRTGFRFRPFEIQSNKARMVLPLPASSDELFNSFKSKLRSQIRRPLKEGCRAEMGGIELLDGFYSIFSRNMRDLGSPVHSKKLFSNIFFEFGDDVKICLVSNRDKPLAAGVFFRFRDSILNPWASSLREYASISPNMLLYWTMLEFACNNGSAFFDFGRSSTGEGTYRFKEQWGAKPKPLKWISFPLRPSSTSGTSSLRKDKFKILMRYWKKLPLPLATVGGPIIRQRISL